MTKLANPAAFFAHLKTAQVLGPTLDQSEVDGVNAILSACGAAGTYAGALFGAKAWEVAKTGKQAADVEIAKTPSGG